MADRKPARKRYVNKHGWWGVLALASTVTVIAVVTTSIIFGLIRGLVAGLSALAAGTAVWVLSALTIAIIAVVWKRHRQLAIGVTMAGFVVKIILFAVLLVVVPTPQTVDVTAVGIGALVSILAWQISEVIAFMRTRRLIYE